MAITFENEKILFDDKYGTAKEIDCFLPVHLTIGGKENDLYKKDGSHNEQYYKWQFLYCFVSAGLCSKDFIGVEVSFPKGNKNSASIKLDAAIFDNKDWFTNIHGITLNHDSDNLNKSVFVKLFLDWYRQNGMIDAYAVGGNGGSLAIKYWDILKFPNFDINKENEIVSLYYSPLNIYNPAVQNHD